MLCYSVFIICVVHVIFFVMFFFFFKQKTAYELRISDWSSDVCSSDLAKRYLPELWVLPLSWSKNTPGERCICETMTRSVPLITKVPCATLAVTDRKSVV